MTAASETIFHEGWLFRFRPATSPSGGLAIALHGWTGNETSMDVFIRSLPENFDIISPRAPFSIHSGGYSWIDTQVARKTALTEYAKTSDLILTALSRWIQLLKIPPQPVHLIGFSQGAAMAYTTLLVYPDQIGAIASLAGFIPAEHNAYLANPLLNRKQIFIAHGSLDEIVPIEMARLAVKTFKNTGAQVTYCEDTVGHKLGAGCYRGLTNFFKEIS